MPCHISPLQNFNFKSSSLPSYFAICLQIYFAINLEFSYKLISSGRIFIQTNRRGDFAEKIAVFAVTGEGRVKVQLGLRQIAATIQNAFFMHFLRIFIIISIIWMLGKNWANLVGKFFPLFMSICGCKQFLFLFSSLSIFYNHFTPPLCPHLLLHSIFVGLEEKPASIFERFSKSQRTISKLAKKLIILACFPFSTLNLFSSLLFLLLIWCFWRFFAVFKLFSRHSATTQLMRTSRSLAA